MSALVSKLLAIPLVNDFLNSALGPQCSNAEALLSNGNCLQLAVSKALGALIVVGGAIVKLPQIYKIVSAKSASGLSLSAYQLETIAYSITLAYNYRNRNPFSTYGETVFVTFQNFAIMLLILHYTKQRLNMLVLALLFGVFNYSLYFNTALIDGKVLQYLQAATIPVSILSKLPQIWQNYKAGSTGQLSAFTVVNYFLGSLARVFTTWKEVKDPIILSYLHLRHFPIFLIHFNINQRFLSF